MSFWNRAKRLLGLTDQADQFDEDRDPKPTPSSTQSHPRAVTAGSKRKGERPPLAEAQPEQSKGIEDALLAREEGDKALARQILQEVDRGRGLRTVLRAAAALEADDHAELTTLLPAVAKEQPRWRLLLQLSAALDDPQQAAPYMARAEHEGAPRWAIAWTEALSSDETIRRRGLVELLFADASLARTVAVRDLHLPAIEADPTAAQRFASFSHGRDCIRRFGADVVAKLVDHAQSLGGP